jgi:hypothetical protein
LSTLTFTFSNFAISEVEAWNDAADDQSRVEGNRNQQFAIGKVENLQLRRVKDKRKT